MGTTAPGLDALLDRAAASCARRGGQLTDLRRQVLRLILQADTPVGAYALLDRLKEIRAGAAPPTVYRALDFLLDQGLVHKVERLNAYICCVEPAGHAAAGGRGHAHDGAGHHPPQFLICRRCGATVEINDPGVAAALGAAAARAGFTLHRATVEAEGVCAGCGKAAAKPMLP